MGRILEMMTVNIQVRDLPAAVAMVQAMGLEPLPLNHMPGPPAYIDDVSVPVGTNGFISLITPNSETSQINELLQKRGPGLNSITVRVDNLREVMAEWSRIGLRWSFPEPQAFLASGHPVVGYRPDRVWMNWIRPSSFFGVTVEVFQFEGKFGRFA
jgi:hypothetical protein